LTLISGVGTSVKELNLSFIQAVDDEICSFIGTNARLLLE